MCGQWPAPSTTRMRAFGYSATHSRFPASGVYVPRAMDHEPGYPSYVVERIGPVESLDGLHHRAEVAADPLRPLRRILAQVRRQADRGGIAEGGGLVDRGPRAAVGHGVVPEVPVLLPDPEIGQRGRVGASGPGPRRGNLTRESSAGPPARAGPAGSPDPGAAGCRRRAPCRVPTSRSGLPARHPRRRGWRRDRRGCAPARPSRPARCPSVPVHEDRRAPDGGAARDRRAGCRGTRRAGR